MAKDVIESLLHRYSLVSDQVDERELKVILSELVTQLTSHREGSVVELGCYIGTTSLFIRRILDHYKSTIPFHVYDSFVGLPVKSTLDNSPAGEQFRVGELAVSRKMFELQFKKAGLVAPIIHKGWFSDLTRSDIPHNITFAYLDGDYYNSILDSLRLVWPNLAPGACVVIDDYANEALPGAARAVDEWLKDHDASIRVQASLAVLRTPS